MNKTFSIIEKLDFLSIGMDFSISSHKKKYSTQLSRILSVIVILLSSTWAFYLASYSLNHTRPNLVYSKQFQAKPYMKVSDLSLVFALVDDSGSTIQNSEKYYRVEARQWLIRTIPRTLENGTIVLDKNTTVNVIKMEKCKKQKNLLNSTYLFDNFFSLESYYCLSENQDKEIYVDGVYGGQNFTGVDLFIRSCSNYTDGPDACMPDNEIKNKLQYTYTSFGFFDYNFDVYNYSTPAQIFLNNNGVIVSNTFYKRMYYSFLNVDYITDSGIFIKEEVKSSYVTYSGTTESLDFRKNPYIPGTFAQITLKMDQLKENYIRSYSKLQELLAQIGGLVNACFIICKVIWYTFCYPLRGSIILEELSITCKSNQIENSKINLLSKDHNIKINSRKPIIIEEEKQCESNKVINPNIKYASNFQKLLMKNSTINNTIEIQPHITKNSQISLRDYLNLILNCSKKSENRILIDQINYFVMDSYNYINLIKKMDNIDFIKQNLFDKSQLQIVEDRIPYFEIWSKIHK